MRQITFIVFSGILLAGVGCGKSGTVLGKPPKGETRTVLAVRDGLTPKLVTLQGKMTSKCPTAGCWFDLVDKTGGIRVDTKGAKFFVSKIPLETEMTVSGKLVFVGDEPVLEATGLRY